MRRRSKSAANANRERIIRIHRSKEISLAIAEAHISGRACEPGRFLAAGLVPYTKETR